MTRAVKIITTARLMFSARCHVCRSYLHRRMLTRTGASMMWNARWGMATHASRAAAHSNKGPNTDVLHHQPTLPSSHYYPSFHNFADRVKYKFKNIRTPKDSFFWVTFNQIGWQLGHSSQYYHTNITHTRCWQAHRQTG